VTSTYGVIHNPQLNDYVALVGYTVAEGSPRPGGNFLFAVLDTDEVGAYSGPNGYVMITRGAIRHMRDESELAGVLGHEIAHVCHHDGLNAIRAAKQSDAGAQALKTAIGNNNGAAVFDAATDMAFDAIFKKGYDKAQELDADRDSVKYIAAVGYDPAGYENFVARIAAEQGNGGADLFATHPGFNERIKVVADAVAATGQGGRGATNRERFLANTVPYGH
jgi:predicted Zn-dependent protease